MGQALRKATASVRPPPSSRPHAAPPAPVRQSVEIRPQTPEPQMIIEPGQNMGEWDRRDPKYAAMVQQVVGKISTRPGDKTEMGDVHVSAELSRPKPMNRHTSAATGPDEETVVAPGTLNVAGVRQLFLEYQSEREGHDKPVDTKSLAERYDVDAVLLERIFHYTSLPDALRRDSRDQIPDQKLKMSPVSY